MGMWYKIKRYLGIVQTNGVLVYFKMRTYPGNPESEKDYVISFEIDDNKEVSIIYSKPFTKMMKKDIVPIIEENVDVYIRRFVTTLSHDDVRHCNYDIRLSLSNVFEKVTYRNRCAEIIC